MKKRCRRKTQFSFLTFLLQKPSRTRFSPML